MVDWKEVSNASLSGLLSVQPSAIISKVQSFESRSKRNHVSKD
ncbi:hypothetical protein [Paenibacillus naphthalenovorans]|nr:hypothetical protein [Paenibacillus naphthalenovorans]